MDELCCVKPFSDFFPCLSLPSLLADEFDVGFQRAVERQAAGFYRFACVRLCVVSEFIGNEITAAPSVR